MLKLTCQCCNVTTEFVDAKEAFNKGWDAPPHFTGYISCNLCPISFLYGVNHTPIHDKWAQDGRPDTFTEETCVVESERTGLIIASTLAAIGKEGIQNMTKYSWNQPICERCWIDRHSTIVWKEHYSVISLNRLPVRIRYNPEDSDIVRQCAYCGAPTFVGIFVRDNPEKVRYPSVENED